MNPLRRCRRRASALLPLAMALLLLAAGSHTLGQNQNVADVLLDMLQQDQPAPPGHLPAGAVVEQEYRYGEGEPVGMVDFVDNEVYILHAKEPAVAFKAFKNLPVFQADTLVSMAKSGMVVLLNDQSRFTMNQNSKVVIEKSLYDEERSTRDTVLDLAAGKARFVARKINPYGSEDFKVRTSVATCGVRGSDFAVALAPDNPLLRGRQALLDPLDWLARPAHAQAGASTMVVLSGPNTTLSLTGTVGPPIILSSFSVTAASVGQPPLPPTPVQPDQATGTLNRIGPPASVMQVPKVFQ